MIIIVGVAGAGKSVQSDMLSRKLGCPWVGIGNLLRNSLPEDQQKKLLMGEMIDDSVTFGVLEAELNRINAKENEFILDGFPRRPSQADWLIDKINQGELKMTAVIHLKANKDTAKHRLLERGRPDDNETAISERFSEYDNTIKPIIDHFRQKNYEVDELDGEQPVEVIHQQILKLISTSK